MTEGSDDRKIIPFTGRVPKDRGNGVYRPDVPMPANVVPFNDRVEDVKKQRHLRPENNPHNLNLVVAAKNRREAFVASAEVSGVVWEYLHQHTEIRTCIAEAKTTGERLWIRHDPMSDVLISGNQIYEPLERLFSVFPRVEWPQVEAELRIWLNTEFLGESEMVPVLEGSLDELYIQWKESKKE